MSEFFSKMKENEYLYQKLNDTIKLYNTYRKQEAFSELENIIYQINMAAIQQKLKVDIPDGNYNTIRKIYKEKDEELYQHFIYIYAQYNEIYESEEPVEQEDFIYLLELVVSMLEVILKKYGDIKIKQ